MLLHHPTGLNLIFFHPCPIYWDRGDFLSGSSILHSTLLLTGADLTLRSVSLMFQVYLADRIGAAGMGKMQLIMTAGAFAMTLGSAGVRVASMNLTARACGKNDPAGMKKAILACMAWGLCFSLFAASTLFLSAPILAEKFVKDTAVIPAMRLLAAFLPAGCLFSVLSGYFTARGQIRTLVIIEIAERISSIAITLLLLRFWAGHSLSRALCAVIGGSSFSTALSLIPLMFLLWKQLRIIPSKSAPIFRQLAGLCVPLAFSDYLRSGLSTIEQFLIPHGLRRSGRGYESAMADYGTVSAMVFPVMMYPAAVFFALSDLLVPELSRCRVQGRMRRARYIVGRSLRVGFLFSAAIAGIMYLLAEPLCKVLYNSEAAGKYLQAFAPLILMLYSDALTDGMLKGLGEQVASVRFNTLTAAIDVVLLWLLLPKHGMGGFYFTFALSHGINFALSIRHLGKVTGFTPNATHGAKTLLLAVFALLVTNRICPPAEAIPSMIFSTIFFSLLFFLISCLTGQLRREDLNLFLPKRKKVSA